jgi:predicted outer membrane repeat protein
MTQRIATIAVSLALIGALFVGAPQRVAATSYSPDLFVAMSGGGYAGTYASECNSPDFTADSVVYGNAGNTHEDNVDIQDAIDAASADQTIYICTGTYDIVHALVDQNKSITLVGAGEANTTLDAYGITNIITWAPVSADRNLSISNMKLYDGRSTGDSGTSGYGGGIDQSSGDLNSDSVTFDSNLASLAGGAVAWSQDAAGVFTITNSTFTNNNAAGGGAIASTGAVSVSDSTFTGNFSTADYNCHGGGGAIIALTDVTVSNSTFTSNVAQLGETDNAYCASDMSLTDEQFGGLGGAIFAGGVEFVSASTFRLNESNYAGGAIYALGSADGSYRGTVTGSHFSGNRQTQEVNDAGCCMNWGGSAIYHFSRGLAVTGSTFDNNGENSDTNGSAIMNAGVCIECDWSDYSANTALSITSSTFTGNHGAHGGAIATGPALTVTSSTFTGNNAYSSGGAITGDVMKISSSTFTGNSSFDGGAIMICGDGSTITGSAFTNNEAVYGGAIKSWNHTFISGSTFRSNHAYSDAGAVWAYNLTVTGSTYVGNSSNNNGGAMRVQSQASVRSSVFSNNSAQARGGAILTNRYDGSKSRFTGNKAGTTGGALFIFNPRAEELLAIRSNTFLRNTATIGGGAVALDLLCVPGNALGRSRLARVTSMNTFSGNRATQLHRTNDLYAYIDGYCD